MAGPEDRQRYQRAIAALRSGEITPQEFQRQISGMSGADIASYGQMDDQGQSIMGLLEKAMMVMGGARANPRTIGSARPNDQNILEQLLGQFPGTTGVPSSTRRVVTNVAQNAASEAPGAAGSTASKSFMQRLLGLAPKSKLGAAGTLTGAGIVGTGIYNALSKEDPNGPPDTAPNVEPGGGSGPAKPLTPAEQIREAIRNGELPLNMGGGGRYDTPADTMNAESARMNAETNRYQAESDRTYREAQVALERGDRVLARQKFEDSQMWAQRAADAQDYANQTGRMNAQTSRFGAQANALTDAFNANTNAYGAQTGRMSAGNNLINILSDLANKQGELALKINSTPRNAIAGMLMSRGQTPDGAGGYRAGNVLGFDPNSLGPLIQAAMQSFQQSYTQPAPQFNLQAALAGLNAAGNAAMQGLPPAQQPAPVSDPSGMRVAGNRVKTAPNSGSAAYGSVLDRMIRGGAPQMVVDQYKKAADEAGYSVGG